MRTRPRADGRGHTVRDAGRGPSEPIGGRDGRTARVPRGDRARRLHAALARRPDSLVLRPGSQGHRLVFRLPAAGRDRHREDRQPDRDGPARVASGFQRRVHRAGGGTAGRTARRAAVRWSADRDRSRRLEPRALARRHVDRDRAPGGLLRRYPDPRDPHRAARRRSDANLRHVERPGPAARRPPRLDPRWRGHLPRRHPHPQRDPRRPDQRPSVDRTGLGARSDADAERRVTRPAPDPRVRGRPARVLGRRRRDRRRPAARAAAGVVAAGPLVQSPRRGQLARQTRAAVARRHGTAAGVRRDERRDPRAGDTRGIHPR